MINKISKISEPIISGAQACAKKSLISSKISDIADISAPKNVVNVFNTLLKKFQKGETLISPGFKGCHGVMIASDGKVLFSHFPPFMNNRMKKSIVNGLQDFEVGKGAQVVFIAPVDTSGTVEKEFTEYHELIREKFTDMDVEFLKYPRKSEGMTTYKYLATMSSEGKLIYSLIPVKE